LRETLQCAAAERARRYPLRRTVEGYSSLYDRLLMRGHQRATSPHFAEASA
jgi:hypothetical protein